MASDRRSMRERMLAGDPYIADDPQLARDSHRAQALLHRFNQLDPNDIDGGRAVLGELLGALGEGTHVRAPLYCDYGYNIRIGSGCFVNFGLVCLGVAAVTIGDDVQIGPNVQLLTPTHPIDPATRRAGWEAAEPISIRDNVWLGGGAIVLPGVTIGENSVVGGGAVVTRDVPADVVVVGNPARILRSVH